GLKTALRKVRSLGFGWRRSSIRFILCCENVSPTFCLKTSAMLILKLLQYLNALRSVRLLTIECGLQQFYF
ncbi:hypothetical protein, partial [Chamaesiphon sp. VAR_48_metabat_403]|uniref:hypothetical protein n=1 Tax=Chamaesiphon sp. VAR_48_metabat_403 TaxID=2964700 RepID=UPI00286DEBD4